MFQVKRILYPTDFSPYSNQAYFHAVALAETHKADMVVTYVYKAGQAPTDGRDSEADRAFWRGQLEQIRPANSAIPVQHVFLEGEPAAEIARYAAESGIDLIVMGTHGRTGRELQLMGSVAEQTLRKAHCSVLVIKLPRATIKPDVEIRGPGLKS